MLDLSYVTNLHLPWPKGRSVRQFTDHIQIHHTVGDYSTPDAWLALHMKRIRVYGWRGIEYSFGVNAQGIIFEGRGLEYKHGAVKNSLTKINGIGAADRSVSITLIGDMRDPKLPTPEQLAAATRLAGDLIMFYNLPVSAILGHREIPLALGGTYPTACPVIDMDAFRANFAKRDLYLADPRMRGDDVKKVQERLLCLGYDIGTYGADGIYGPATDRGVKLLSQRAKEIHTDMVDNEMRALLGL